MPHLHHLFMNFKTWPSPLLQDHDSTSRHYLSLILSSSLLLSKNKHQKPLNRQPSLYLSQKKKKEGGPCTLVCFWSNNNWIFKVMIITKKKVKSFMILYNCLVLWSRSMWSLDGFVCEHSVLWLWLWLWVTGILILINLKFLTTSLNSWSRLDSIYLFIDVQSVLYWLWNVIWCRIKKKKSKKRYVHSSLGVNILKPVCDPKSCNGSTSKSNLIHSDDLIWSDCNVYRVILKKSWRWHHWSIFILVCLTCRLVWWIYFNVHLIIFKMK